MNNKKKLAFRIVIGLAIIIFALIFVDFTRKQPKTANTIAWWPSFETKDVSGGIIRGKDFKKRARYVQFVGAADNNNISLLEDVYRFWADQVDIFVFIKNDRLFRERIKSDFSKAIIIKDDFDDMSRLFKSTKYGKHYLFGQKGNVIFSAENNLGYDSGVVRFLQYIINHRQFQISEFIREKDRLYDRPEFKQISDAVEKMRGEFLLVGLIYSFCDSCASGPVVDAFRKIHVITRGRADLLLILSREYRRPELDVFRSQLRVEFPVVIADHALSERWEALTNQYSRITLNKIIFVTDREGRIVKILDPQCRTCEKSFWDWVRDRAVLLGKE
jgi:hypothetical protein